MADDKTRELLGKYNRVATDKSQLQMFVSELIKGNIDTVASTEYVDTAITGAINEEY